MRTIEQTSAFKRDLKRESKGQHRAYLAEHFAGVVAALANDEVLETRLHDHALTGDWRGFRDCHIRPDLVLIYAKAEPEALQLVRLGCAVMAPDISKVDPDRHLGLRAAAWNFSNEVMRRLFHGNSLSDLKDLLIPFFGKFETDRVPWWSKLPQTPFAGNLSDERRRRSLLSSASSCSESHFRSLPIESPSRPV
jgi:mRNA interferase YafQ